MTPKAARQKGKDLEDHIADQIVAYGIDPKARRDGGSGNGNREKGDIITSMMVFEQNAGIEAKNQKTLSIPEWWRQTKKLESLGREPILAFKQHGEGMEETKVIIYLDTFLRLVKASKGVSRVATDAPVVESDENSRDRKYRLERVKTAISEALRYL